MGDEITKLLNLRADFLAETVRDRKLGFGLFGYFMGAFAFTFFVNFARGCGIFSFIAQLAMYFVLFAFAGLLFAALTQMFLDLTAKKGNAPGLFALIGMSEFINVFLISGALIAAAFGAGPAVMGMLFTAVFIIQIVFLIYLVARAYEMSAGTVFFSMILTVFPSMMVAVLIVCITLAAFAALIIGLAR